MSGMIPLSPSCLVMLVAPWGSVDHMAADPPASFPVTVVLVVGARKGAHHGELGEIRSEPGPEVVRNPPAVSGAVVGADAMDEPVDHSAFWRSWMSCLMSSRTLSAGEG